MRAYILRITRGQILADRKMYTATVHHPGDKYPQRYTFVGSSHGLGPVFISWDGYQAQVDQPERFGDTFNRLWVNNFFTQET